MKIISSKGGNNLIEYLILFILVGFVFGYTILTINPKVYRDYFKTSFGNSSGNNSVTIAPMSD